MDPFIQDFSILFLITVAVSFLIKLLRQPIIIGYVLSGLLFVPYAGSSAEQVKLLSDLGITFLLFLMGMEFDFKNLKYFGKDLFIATFLQSVIFFALAFIPAFLMGLENPVYLAVLFMFSSTLLVAKWVEDKKETQSMKGKIILGILILQDLFAIIMMTFLQAFDNPLELPVGGLILIAIAFVFGKFFLNGLLRIANRFPELLFIFGLGICFFFVEIASLLGFSETIGAFIAGVMLANTEYKNELYARLKPLIIFFNMLFFVGLGFQMNLDLKAGYLVYLLIIFALVFLVKPVIVMLTLKMRGYDIKVSFLSGLNLAQLSEFGIIIIAGAGLSPEINSFAVISVIGTMIVSSYIIKEDKSIYLFFERFLSRIDRYWTPMKRDFEKQKYDIIFFGYHELGKELLSKLGKKRFLVVESDPASIELLKEEKIPYSYNSIVNPYFFNSLDLEGADLIVSNLPDMDDNKLIIKKAKAESPKTVIIATAKSLKGSLELYDLGADYVICPSYINEQHVSVLLEDYATDINRLITKKVNDITSFKEKTRKAENQVKFFDINTFMRRISRK